MRSTYSVRTRADPHSLNQDSDDDVGDGKKRKREKKAKKIKDPNAPKRPASAYLEFQNAVRAQFREADPNLAYSEVLRKIADTWSHMSADDKKVSSSLPKLRRALSLAWRRFGS